jgi:PAS domain S-box-containing protein
VSPPHPRRGFAPTRRGHPAASAGHPDRAEAPSRYGARPLPASPGDVFAGGGEGLSWVPRSSGAEVTIPAAPSELDELAGLRLLVERSTDMLARHDRHGTYRYVSPACRELLGYEPAQLVGRSAYELIHPADVPAVRATHDDVVAGTEVRTVAYRVRHRRDGYRWFETTAHAVRDPATGHVVEIQTSSRDISDRREADVQLRESEQRFRLAMTHAPIGMALVGLDGSFVEVNDRLCELLGRSRESLLASTFQNITHVDDLDIDVAYAAQLLAGQIAHYELEKRYVHPSGGVVWALLSGSLVRDDAGQPLYFIAQVVDISARKRALVALERTGLQLQRSNAELERYAAVVAHDLRAPLATIGGFLELLIRRDEHDLDEEAQQVLTIARRVTDQMAETIEGLLTLARVTTDALTHEPVDVGSLLDEVLASIGPTLEAVEADLRSEALPTVQGDRVQLRLLLQNLLLNAAKFRDPVRPLVVRIDAVQEGTSWRFTVADNGRGFDPADAERIFEPFVRTSSGHDLGGVGIGLATCRRIVERHGGSIRALAARPGACIAFTLPAGTPPAGAG